MQLFYPDFIPPLVKVRRGLKEAIQTTIAIIRPSAMADFKEKIIDIILNNKFQILRKQEFKFNRNEAELFYTDNASDIYFEDLISEMTEGPFLVLLLSREVRTEFLILIIIIYN